MLTFCAKITAARRAQIPTARQYQLTVRGLALELEVPEVILSLRVVFRLRNDIVKAWCFRRTNDLPRDSLQNQRLISSWMRTHVNRSRKGETCAIFIDAHRRDILSAMLRTFAFHAANARADNFVVTLYAL
jgi:hypothetical protein